MISNVVAKNFDILTTPALASYIIILIIQQDYFQIFIIAK